MQTDSEKTGFSLYILVYRLFFSIYVFVLHTMSSKLQKNLISEKEFFLGNLRPTCIIIFSKQITVNVGICAGSPHCARDNLHIICLHRRYKKCTEKIHLLHIWL